MACQGGEQHGELDTTPVAHIPESAATQRSVPGSELPTLHERIGRHDLGAIETATPAPTLEVAVTEPPIVTERVPDAPAELVALVSLYPWPIDQMMRIIDRETGGTWRCDAWNPVGVWYGGVEHHASGPLQVLEPMHADVTVGDVFSCEGGIATGFNLYQQQGLTPWLPLP